MLFRLTRFALFAILLFTVIQVTVAQTATGPSELKYKLIQQFGDPFFCDKDLWPVARPEQPRADEWFAGANYADPEFKVILTHLNLQKPADHLQSDEILAVYREHKKLQAITVEGSGSPYKFSVRTGKVGEQGESLSGTISDIGDIKIETRETLWNTCPKCLAAGTRIDTPLGEVAVQDLRAGMPIWTMDQKGKRRQGVVVSAARVPVPLHHEVVRLQLANGRTLLASPEHPLPDGRVVGDLQAGETLSDIAILNAQQIPYNGDSTYDVLPSGPTGFYWAEGVLLGTTISH